MSGRIHPLDLARRLAIGDTHPDEARHVVRHLLEGCAECSAAARGAWKAPPTDGAALRRAVDRAIEHSFEQVGMVRREQSIAASLVAELARHPLDRARTLITNSKRFQRRSVCEELIARSAAARHDDTAETLRYAELAVVAAECLVDRCPEDAQAAAWTELGNARRLCGDLEGAEDAFQHAEELLAEGAGDLQLEAEFLLMLAVLRVYQRRFRDAQRLNHRARRIYERLHDREGVARSLFQIGKAHGKEGNAAAGLRSIWAGLRLLGPDPDPKLVFPAIHNLIILIEEAGASRAAAGLLKAARPLYQAVAGELDLARLDWLRARVQTGLGMLDDAAFLLEGLRVRFANHDLAYEVALVSLDLADVYARQRRSFELRVLLHEAIPVFRSLGVTREALAGAVLLRQMGLRTARAVELIQALVRDLKSQRQRT